MHKVFVWSVEMFIILQCLAQLVKATALPSIYCGNFDHAATPIANGSD